MWGCIGAGEIYKLEVKNCHRVRKASKGFFNGINSFPLQQQFILGSKLNFGDTKKRSRSLTMTRVFCY